MMKIMAVHSLVLGGKEKNEEVGAKNNAKNLSMPLVSTTVIVVLLVIYSTNLNPARANMATLRVLRGVYALQGDVKSLYEKA